ncbi:MAG: 50S ribosomal protein L21 [Parcubacteria group bacterium]
MQFAIIKTGGKQYNVQAGQTLKVEKIEGEVGAKIKFDQVLLLVDGDKFDVGKPVVEKAVVEAEITAQGRSKKVIVMKFKPKVRYKRKKGHRQLFTTVRILAIK